MGWLGINEWICRRNIIAADPENYDDTSAMKGIEVSNIGKFVAEENILNDIVETNGLRDSNCGTVSALNNQTPAGRLVHAYDTTALSRRMELQDSMEDLLTGV